jgi:hypothetical protein
MDAHNTLYSEINWFYPSKDSLQINRVVTYNYEEQTWTTGTLARSNVCMIVLFILIHKQLNI